MASRFDVTTPTTTLALDESRSGLASFTVTSTDPSTIGGDAVVVAAPGAASEWFTVKDPSRTYPPGQTEQLAVAIAVPPDAPAGRYSFRLRVLLAGGVPEEDFDDSPVVSFDVVAPPEVVPEPPPPKKPFPWWIVVLVGAIVVAVIGVAAFFLLDQQPPARIALHAGTGGTGAVVCELDASEGFHPLAATEGCQDEVVGSLALANVPSATRIEVFGSPSCTRTTDWADVRTLERVPTHVVQSFETAVDGPPVSVVYHPRTGPWRDVFGEIDDRVATQRIVSIGDGSPRSIEGIRALEVEVAAAGGEVMDVQEASVLTPETLARQVEDAAAQGASAVFVDAANLDLAQREELVAAIDPNLRDIIWWPGGPDPEGLNGKVSCVRVSRVTA